MRYPYARPALGETAIQAAAAVLRSPQIGMGPQTESFERALSTASGLSHIVAVQTGTVALQLAFRAAGAGKGAIVLFPALQFVGAANAAVLEGARLALADVDPVSGILDLNLLETRLKHGERFTAVCMVAYAGRPFDLPRAEQLAKTYRFRLIADQSHAPVRPFRIPPHPETLVTFSFQAVKHLTSGEGGAVGTGMPEIAARLRRLRNHGTERTAFPAGPEYTEAAFLSQEPAFNSRMTDFQAALLLEQLRSYDEQARKRRLVAASYQSSLEGIEQIAMDPAIAENDHALHLFTIRAQNRNGLFRHLYEHGIGTQVHWVPLQRHPGLLPHFVDTRAVTPAAEQLFSSLLSLPFYPELSPEDVAIITKEIRRFYDQRSRSTSTDRIP